MMTKPLFPGQQDHEKIYLLIRAHWVVLAQKVAVWFIFVILLVMFDSYLISSFAWLKTSPWPEIANLLKTLYLMGLIAGLFSVWILYYLNYQIVTNERVVDVDQKNLLHHATSELHLENIEDVTAQIKGIFGNVFNYGTVYIQTAGEARQFEFDNVPDPHKVAKLILDLYERLPKHE